MVIPGGAEWVIIGGVVLVLFGARAIPKFARSIGRAKREFEKGIKDLNRTAEGGGIFCYTFFKGIGTKWSAYGSDKGEENWNGLLTVPSSLREANVTGSAPLKYEMYPLENCFILSDSSPTIWE